MAANDNRTLCAICGVDLSTKEIIYAAEGQLYCSKECCIEDIADENIDTVFEDTVEELTPAEIGLEV